jgi:hypothetical protein
MTTMTKSYPVRPVFTSTHDMTTAPLTKQTVRSKSAAVRLCRNLGYVVLTAGGLVELATDTVDSETGSESLAWIVTVHAEKAGA